MTAKKVNVEKLMAKLSGVSIEQKAEIHEKLGAQIEESRDAVIREMEETLARLKSGGPLKLPKTAEEIAAEQQEASAPAGEKKSKKQLKAEAAQAQTAEATL